MGIGYQDAFPEIWDVILPVFEHAETTRTAGEVNNMHLMIMRNGFLEETTFNGSFIPLRGDSGRIEGFYNCVWEKTRDVIRERRTAMLNNISSWSEQVDTSNIGQYIIRQLETNPLDVPMAILYQITDNSDAEEVRLRMIGSIGLPEHHTFATSGTLESDHFPIPLLKAAKNEVVDASPGSNFGDVNWRGFGEPSTTVSAIPLRNGGRLFGFLVTAANPRRPIDPDHHQLNRDMAKHAAGAIATVVGIEEAKKRQDRLEKELAFSERQLRYLCDHASISMASFSTAGELLWANDQYYIIMGYEKSVVNDSKSFLEYVHADSIEETGTLFANLAAESRPVSLEVKLNRLFSPPVGPPEPAYVLAWGFPYLEEGKTTTLMSVMTDVSRLKWSEKWQARAAEEAREAKRNQDQFIDSISHEIRNPLSAIFQLADKISTSTGDAELQHQTMEGLRAALDENVEAARTILLCAKHQKRIVDDVLTISKLDFLLLTLAPIPVSPADMVQSVVKMFEGDASAHSVILEIEKDESLSANAVNWVLCDPSRLLQIFINLITNAIKFTKSKKLAERKIVVKYGACTSDPRSQFPAPTIWAPNGESTNIDLALIDLPPSEALYLLFSVTDTGAGIKEGEVHNIFSRFSQASARTFVKYGGSGLGLYISQRLAEKQGGEIGVVSEHGHGSTFAFYIKCSRAQEPPLAAGITILDSPIRHRSPSVSASSAYAQGFAVPTMTPPPFSSINPADATPAKATPKMIPEADGAIHVLLVEDNLVNQQVLRKQLVKLGCVVSVANHGREALEVLKNMDCWLAPPPDAPQKLDFVLMDWEMPVMNGLDCSREIRRLEAEGKIRGASGPVEIIAITANARQEQIATALEAGVNEVLPKPFMVRDLMQRMRDRIAKSRSLEGDTGPEGRLQPSPFN